MTSTNSMLKHQMVVLKNVHEFDEIFKRELIKSKRWLELKELTRLKKWLLKKYDERHSKTINRVLRGIPI